MRFLHIFAVSVCLVASSVACLDPSTQPTPEEIARRLDEMNKRAQERRDAAKAAEDKDRATTEPVGAQQQVVCRRYVAAPNADPWAVEWAAEIEGRRLHELQDAYRFVEAAKAQVRDTWQRLQSARGREDVAFARTAYEAAAANLRNSRDGLIAAATERLGYSDKTLKPSAGSVGILRGSVFQVLGATEMLVKGSGKVWKVVGTDTTNMVDGSPLKPQWFEVVGTTTYETVLGAPSTVFQIRPTQVANELKIESTTIPVELFESQIAASMEH